MPTFNSLEELFDALPGAIDRGMRRAATDIGIAIEQRAQAKLGEYQPGWPQLADATQTERVSLGFSPNDPLLRTGGLKDSIQGAVDPISGGYRVVVGSDAPQARIQELGGVNSGRPGLADIPPRPYLAPALVEDEDAIQQAVALSIAREIGNL